MEIPKEGLKQCHDYMFGYDKMTEEIILNVAEKTDLNLAIPISLETPSTLKPGTPTLSPKPSPKPSTCPTITKEVIIIKQGVMQEGRSKRKSLV